jgi:hypothetical protein
MQEPSNIHLIAQMVLKRTEEIDCPKGCSKLKDMWDKRKRFRHALPMQQLWHALTAAGHNDPLLSKRQLASRYRAAIRLAINTMQRNCCISRYEGFPSHGGIPKSSIYLGELE